SRRVIAKAEYQMDTMFFRMVGLPQLPVVAVSSATQRQQPVELSLVLDISGTMRWNDRLVNLQPAAVAFVNAIADDSVDGLTTINL
ncbi:MAG: pilus assembly protein, partial [Desulfuromonadales bacterium]|nr:pilus assembly protein [Desulfuromonadales bacterium]